MRSSDTVIDLHAHLLPGVDDGSPSLHASIEMLDAAAAIGMQTIVATPHLLDPLTPEYDAKVRTAWQQVEPHAEARRIEMIAGFEVRIRPDLPARLRRGEPITLGTSRAVLIDLPHHEWPRHVDDTLFNILRSGFQPILAHPERYPRIQREPEIGRALAESGVALQLTIGSFVGIFGRRVRRTAETLLELGAVHLVATDAHSAADRMAAVPAGLRRLRHLAGEEGLRQLTTSIARPILRGEALPPPVTTFNYNWRDRLAI